MCLLFKISTISWQIWLERNKRIFRNKEQDVSLVAITVKCQLNGCLRDRMDDSSLCQQDIELGAALSLQFQKLIIIPIHPKEWQIQKK